MKTVCLEECFGRSHLAAQSSFPVGNPFFDFVIFIIGRAKQMNMVRHDQAEANWPCHSRVPGFYQRIVNGIIGKVGSAFATTNCDEDNRRLITKNKNAFRRMATA